MLLMTPPDPTSLKPRQNDLRGLAKMARHRPRVRPLGEKQMYETIRFWTMSCGDFLDEHFETDVIKGHWPAARIIGTALGPYSPGSAYVLLHHYMGEVDGSIGAWGFARGGMGAISNALASAGKARGCEIRTDAEITDVIVEKGRAVGSR